MKDHTKKPDRGNPKAHHKPKSVEEWREELDRTCDDAYGRFKLLSRLMLNSQAYSKLTRGGMIFVNTMLSWLAYESNGTKGRRNVRGSLRHRSEVLKNDGRFTVTNNELHARGIASDSTISDARDLAWKLGFFNVLKSATLVNPGVYQYSLRWQLYPDGEYKPEGQPPPGRCLYPNKSLSKSKPTTEIAVTDTTEIAVKDGVALPTRSKGIRGLDGQSTLQKSQLITKLGKGARLGPHRAPEHRATRYGKGSGVSTPPKTHLDPEILKMAVPAKVIALMESRGHTCALAQKHSKEILLNFSDGSSIRIGSKDYTYNGPGGKPSYVSYLLETLEPLLPVTAQAADSLQSPVAAQIEETLLNHGYGSCRIAEVKHRELHLEFAAAVHVWIVPGSIKVERPGKRKLTVKNPEMLAKQLASENSSQKR